MKRYLYYPGCSLEGTALEYEISTRAVMKALGYELEEIEDWTCCGAGAAESVSHLLSLALPARNLAIADKSEKCNDILVPCSACYLNLKKVEEKTKKDPELREKLNTILNESGLKITGKARVRHLLDILSVDVGADAIAREVQKYREVNGELADAKGADDRCGAKESASVKRRFDGFRFAPYYGCQCLRPYAAFDDPEFPVSMEPLIEATGAKVHRWSMGAKCCGASHMNTDPEVSLNLVKAILLNARGADAVITVCPMCQMNLEAYQGKISSMCKENLKIPVLYLPQLIGLALGISHKELRLDLNLSSPLSDHHCQEQGIAAEPLLVAGDGTTVGLCKRSC